jgi:ribosomal protein S18 acetylase RimI-like enzyme
MIRAKKKDKEICVDILSHSFTSNQTVNFLVGNGRKKIKRVRALLGYSFEMGMAFGDVFLSDGKQACCIVVYPDRKKAGLKLLLLNLYFIFNAAGWRNLRKILKREKVIGKTIPKIRMCHLWFIGVDPLCQGKGIGLKLLGEIIDYSQANCRPVYLETSTLKNLPWYRRFGFEVYSQQDFPFRLYFFKREIR